MYQKRDKKANACNQHLHGIRALPKIRETQTGVDRISLCAFCFLVSFAVELWQVETRRGAAMTPAELRKLIAQEENPKLDFKIEYSLTRPEEWNELIKDILALANGNVGFANKAGYLIVGAGDTLRPDHARELKDASGLGINRHDLLAKVNAVCNPRLPNLHCELVELDGNRVLVVSIPPSPHLHELKIPLQTPKRRFQEQTVLIRCGEEILPATHEERLALEAEKKRIVATDQPAVPLSENRSLEFITDPDVLLAKLYAEENDYNPLARHNIPYQRRDPQRDIQRELRSALNSTRYLLIAAPTGIGKTREAATLAQTLMHEGYRVVRVKSGNLQVPREFPPELSDDPRRILIFVDNLNFLFRSAEPIVAPMTSDTAAFKQESYHGALLTLFNTFEKWCGESEIRVIAAARDDPEMWQVLNFSPRDPLWKRFTRYELPAPSNGAIVKLLEESVARANLQAEEKDYPAIAKRNDKKFSTIVENLRDAQRENKAVTLGNFADTLDNMWRDQYERVLHKRPATRYVYDAIDLLTQIGIDLYPWIVEPTACLLWNEGEEQSVKYQRDVNRTLKYLLKEGTLAEEEGWLAPRDGQIEAKGKKVNWKDYIIPLQDIILHLANIHPQEFPDLVNGLAGALLNDKQLEQAEAVWRKGINLAPHSPMLWNGLGAALSYLQRDEDAKHAFQHAIDNDPNYIMAYTNLGITYKKLGSNSEAEQNFRQALEIDPEYYNASLELGRLLSQLKRYSEAEKVLARFSELYPDDPESNALMGAVLAELGEYETAVIFLRDAIELDPANRFAHHNLGLSLAILKKFEEAVGVLQRAIELNPNDGHSHYLLGYAEGELGHDLEAEKAYDRAIAIAPTLVDAYVRLGYLLEKLRQPHRAVDLFNKAIRENPNDPILYFHLGRMLVKLERDMEAIEALKYVVAHSQDEEQLHSASDILEKLRQKN
ncbi:MAG: tetratricopeptide repeat protein, partial [Chloroflexi bacterium]|nr:tetratricopeptide repeat protein [Chloroflexota bacterium]